MRERVHDLVDVMNVIFQLVGKDVRAGGIAPTKQEGSNGFVHKLQLSVSPADCAHPSNCCQVFIGSWVHRCRQFIMSLWFLGASSFRWSCCLGMHNRCSLILEMYIGCRRLGI